MKEEYGKKVEKKNAEGEKKVEVAQEDAATAVSACSPEVGAGGDAHLDNAMAEVTVSSTSNTGESDAKTRICDECGKFKAQKGREVKICSRCKLVAYCGVDCQAKAWPKHRHGCVAKK